MWKRRVCSHVHFTIVHNTHATETLLARDNWIKKRCYTHTQPFAILFSLTTPPKKIESIKIKKKRTLPYATTWMNLEGIRQNEISQSHEGKYCMIALSCGI